MGDRYAGFDAFVASRGAALMRTASLLTGNRAAAEDALQEALTRVAMRWPKVVRGGAPEPYVRRVLYTVVVDDWRRRRRLDVEPGDAPEGSDGVDLAHMVSSAVVLNQALLRITARQRAVLVLRYYDDLTEAQAADVLGCSISTVKSQTKHALNRLRVLAPELIAAFAPEEERVEDINGDSSSSEVLT
ncbi:MAG TPA: SigE family RNA polymerase sigma factor [Actinomycetes bacterium]|nr:SigE family RNA polymerase sigma factor [Actinomycetes bacterium]